MERLQNICNWTVPIITKIVCLLFGTLAVALYFIPFHVFLAAVISTKFILRALFYYHPFGIFQNKTNVNELLELIGRVPSRVEVQQRKNFAVKHKTASSSQRSVTSTITAANTAT